MGAPQIVCAAQAGGGSSHSVVGEGTQCLGTDHACAVRSHTECGFRVLRGVSLDRLAHRQGLKKKVFPPATLTPEVPRHAYVTYYNTEYYTP